MYINIQPYPVRPAVAVLDPDMKCDRLGQILLSLWLGFFIAHPLAADSTAQSGNELIDGRMIKPYSLTWSQCSLKEGQWISQGSLHEKLDLIGEMVIRHRQTTMRPDGGTGVATAYFDRRSFSVLRIEQEIHQADGMKAVWAEYDFDQRGYSGRKARGEDTKEVSGSLTSNMLNGAALGLPLASLEWQEQPLSLLASMIAFDASYDVTVTWAGKEEMTMQDGASVEAWLIDLEWKHRELDDIYPPGPDASGGRFWIVQQPPDGFPYVVRYKTDTYVIEFIQEFCPTAN